MNKTFNKECDNVHNGKRSEQLSFMNDNVMHAIQEKSRENRRFTMVSFSLHFP